jgi:hypothetical protein
VSRTEPGAFGRFRQRWTLPVVIALVMVSACGGGGNKPKFELSLRNAGDVPIRVKVIVASEGRPSRDLLIPARSGILQTEERTMDVKDGKPDPVTVEIYTDTCALITTVTAGEGRTRIVIGEDLSISTSGGAPDSSGAVAPEPVAAC